MSIEYHWISWQLSIQRTKLTITAQHDKCSTCAMLSENRHVDWISLNMLASVYTENPTDNYSPTWQMFYMCHVEWKPSCRLSITEYLGSCLYREPNWQLQPNMTNVLHVPCWVKTVMSIEYHWICWQLSIQRTQLTITAQHDKCSTCAMLSENRHVDWISLNMLAAVYTENPTDNYSPTWQMFYMCHVERKPSCRLIITEYVGSCLYREPNWQLQPNMTNVLHVPCWVKTVMSIEYHWICWQLSIQRTQLTITAQHDKCSTCAMLSENRYVDWISLNMLAAVYTENPTDNYSPTWQMFYMCHVEWKPSCRLSITEYLGSCLYREPNWQLQPNMTNVLHVPCWVKTVMSIEYHWICWQLSIQRTQLTITAQHDKCSTCAMLSENRHVDWVSLNILAAVYTENQTDNYSPTWQMFYMCHVEWKPSCRLSITEYVGSCLYREPNWQLQPNMTNVLHVPCWAKTVMSIDYHWICWQLSIQRTQLTITAQHDKCSTCAMLSENRYVDWISLNMLAAVYTENPTDNYSPTWQMFYMCHVEWKPRLKTVGMSIWISLNITEYVGSCLYREPNWQLQPNMTNVLHVPCWVKTVMSIEYHWISWQLSIQRTQLTITAQHDKCSTCAMLNENRHVDWVSLNILAAVYTETQLTAQHDKCSTCANVERKPSCRLIITEYFGSCLYREPNWQLQPNMTNVLHVPCWVKTVMSIDYHWIFWQLSIQRTQLTITAQHDKCSTCAMLSENRYVDWISLNILAAVYTENPTDNYSPTWQMFYMCHAEWKPSCRLNITEYLGSCLYREPNWQLQPNMTNVLHVPCGAKTVMSIDYHWISWQLSIQRTQLTITAQHDKCSTCAMLSENRHVDWLSLNMLAAVYTENPTDNYSPTWQMFYMCHVENRVENRGMSIDIITEYRLIGSCLYREPNWQLQPNMTNVLHVPCWVKTVMSIEYHWIFWQLSIQRTQLTITAQHDKCSTCAMLSENRYIDWISLNILAAVYTENPTDNYSPTWQMFYMCHVERKPSCRLIITEYLGSCLYREPNWQLQPNMTNVLHVPCWVKTVMSIDYHWISWQLSIQRTQLTITAQHDKCSTCAMLSENRLSIQRTQLTITAQHDKCSTCAMLSENRHVDWISLNMLAAVYTENPTDNYSPAWQMFYMCHVEWKPSCRLIITEYFGSCLYREPNWQLQPKLTNVLHVPCWAKTVMSIEYHWICWQLSIQRTQLTITHDKCSTNPTEQLQPNMTNVLHVPCGAKTVMSIDYHWISWQLSIQRTQLTITAQHDKCSTCAMLSENRYVDWISLNILAAVYTENPTDNYSPTWQMFYMCHAEWKPLCRLNITEYLGSCLYREPNWQLQPNMTNVLHVPCWAKTVMSIDYHWISWQLSIQRTQLTITAQHDKCSTCAMLSENRHVDWLSLNILAAVYTENPTDNYSPTWQMFYMCHVEWKPSCRLISLNMLAAVYTENPTDNYSPTWQMFYMCHVEWKPSCRLNITEYVGSCLYREPNWQLQPNMTNVLHVPCWAKTVMSIDYHWICWQLSIQRTQLTITAQHDKCSTCAMLSENRYVDWISLNMLAAVYTENPTDNYSPTWQMFYMCHVEWKPSCRLMYHWICWQLSIQRTQLTITAQHDKCSTCAMLSENRHVDWLSLNILAAVYTENPTDNYSPTWQMFYMCHVEWKPSCRLRLSLNILAAVYITEYFGSCLYREPNWQLQPNMTNVLHVPCWVKTVMSIEYHWIFWQLSIQRTQLTITAQHDKCSTCAMLSENRHVDWLSLNILAAVYTENPTDNYSPTWQMFYMCHVEWKPSCRLIITEYLGSCLYREPNWQLQPNMTNVLHVPCWAKTVMSIDYHWIFWQLSIQRTQLTITAQHDKCSTCAMLSENRHVDWISLNMLAAVYTENPTDNYSPTWQMFYMCHVERKPSCRLIITEYVGSCQRTQLTIRLIITEYVGSCLYREPNWQLQPNMTNVLHVPCWAKTVMSIDYHWIFWQLSIQRTQLTITAQHDKCSTCAMLSENRHVDWISLNILAAVYTENPTDNYSPTWQMFYMCHVSENRHVDWLSLNILAAVYTENPTDNYSPTWQMFYMCHVERKPSCRLIITEYFGSCLYREPNWQLQPNMTNVLHVPCWAKTVMSIDYHWIFWQLSIQRTQLTITAQHDKCSTCAMLSENRHVDWLSLNILAAVYTENPTDNYSPTWQMFYMCHVERKPSCRLYLTCAMLTNVLHVPKTVMSIDYHWICWPVYTENPTDNYSPTWQMFYMCHVERKPSCRLIITEYLAAVYTENPTDNYSPTWQMFYMCHVERKPSCRLNITEYVGSCLYREPNWQLQPNMTNVLHVPCWAKTVMSIDYHWICWQLSIQRTQLTITAQHDKCSTCAMLSENRHVDWLSLNILAAVYTENPTDNYSPTWQMFYMCHVERKPSCRLNITEYVGSCLYREPNWQLQPNMTNVLHVPCWAKTVMSIDYHWIFWQLSIQRTQLTITAQHDKCSTCAMLSENRHVDVDWLSLNMMAAVYTENPTDNYSPTWQMFYMCHVERKPSCRLIITEYVGSCLYREPNWHAITAQHDKCSTCAMLSENRHVDWLSLNMLAAVYTENPTDNYSPTWQMFYMCHVENILAAVYNHENRYVDWVSLNILAAVYTDNPTDNYSPTWQMFYMCHVERKPSCRLIITEYVGSCLYREPNWQLQPNMTNVLHVPCWAKTVMSIDYHWICWQLSIQRTQLTITAQHDYHWICWQLSIQRTQLTITAQHVLHVPCWAKTVMSIDYHWICWQLSIQRTQLTITAQHDKCSTCAMLSENRHVDWQMFYMCHVERKVYWISLNILAAVYTENPTDNYSPTWQMFYMCHVEWKPLCRLNITEYFGSCLYREPNWQLQPNMTNVLHVPCWVKTVMSIEYHWICWQLSIQRTQLTITAQHDKCSTCAMLSENRHVDWLSLNILAAVYTENPTDNYSPTWQMFYMCHVERKPSCRLSITEYFGRCLYREPNWQLQPNMTNVLHVPCWVKTVMSIEYHWISWQLSIQITQLTITAQHDKCSTCAMLSENRHVDWLSLNMLAAVYTENPTDNYSPTWQMFYMCHVEWKPSCRLITEYLGSCLYREPNWQLQPNMTVTLGHCKTCRYTSCVHRTRHQSIHIIRQHLLACTSNYMYVYINIIWNEKFCVGANTNIVNKIINYDTK